MKKNIVFFVLIFAIISCNPFEEKRVLNYEKELNSLVSRIEKYESGSYDRDDIDEFIIDEIRSLDIDVIVRNNDKKIKAIQDLWRKMIV